MIDQKTMAMLACAELKPDQIAGLTPAQIAGLKPAQIAWLKPDQIAWLTPDQIAWLKPDQIAWLAMDPNMPAPKVDKLYSRMAADLEASKRKLDQWTWGPEERLSEKAVCRTPMCIAGHTVNLAGEEGYALKAKFGWAIAASLIHRKSRPDAPLPRYDSYPNEWALAYIRERAAEESQVPE